jgi:hypothetical protein
MSRSEENIHEGTKGNIPPFCLPASIVLFQKNEMSKLPSASPIRPESGQHQKWLHAFAILTCEFNIQLADHLQASSHIGRPTRFSIDDHHQNPYLY